jgi:arabinogalactan endo-1,4-beta-galactosidase
VSLVKDDLSYSNSQSIRDKRDDDSFFYKGHDLSSLKLLEDGGSIFKDTAKYNQTRPAEDILGDGGMNTVRLRIWVNPSDGVNGLNYTLDLAKRFYKKGYKIYLDFHFA